MEWTYSLISFLTLVKRSVILLLIPFVLLKPLDALVFQFCGEKIEMSAIDSDQKDLETEDSQEEDTEEDTKEKEKFQEEHAINVSEEMLFDQGISAIDFIKDHFSDFELGIVVPPPEAT